MFDISFFKQNPEPFYALAHELYPGKYHPTLAHCFVRLLDDKGLLLKTFTQNIDCLEREAGVANDKIVEAHGSFARQRCIECKTEFSDELMREAVAKKDVPHCIVPQCNGLVKPDIVFFGEGLPREFFENARLPSEADLGIVMGTSLTVYPFAALPGMISRGTPRLLINKEKVGDLGAYPEDVMLLGDIDEGVMKLAEALGWSDELTTIWKEKNPGKALEAKEEAKRSRDENFQEEMEKLTKEVEASLQVSADHNERIRKGLEGEMNVSKQKEEKLAIPEANSHPSGTEGYASPPGLRHVFPHLGSKPSL